MCAGALAVAIATTIRIAAFNLFLLFSTVSASQQQKFDSMGSIVALRMSCQIGAAAERLGALLKVLCVRA